jgi:hypothetical protein
MGPEDEALVAARKYHVFGDKEKLWPGTLVTAPLTPD